MTKYVFRADIDKFNANTTRYNGENALALVDCALLAYSPEEVIKEAMQTTWKFKNFKFFDGGNGTQAFIAGNDAIIIIAFRGTEFKLEDFKSDAQLKLTDDPEWAVHRGFNKALHQVWGVTANDDMRKTIKEFQDNNQTVWFCGHSLGAALATLAAAEYAIKDSGVVNGLYTIGQPRVGNDKFAARFDAVLKDKCFRFVNNNDIVTRVPLPGPLFKYRHLGNALYLDSNGNLQDSIPWWTKLLDRLKGVKDDIGEKGIDALKDHSSEDYVQLVCKNRSISTKWS